MYNSIQPRKSEEQIAFYIPENYNIDTLPAEWRDYGAYVLSTINARIVYERLDPDQPVPLMSQLLKLVLPKRDYVKILNMLADNGVIARTKKYQVGEYSKGILIAEQYRHVKYKRYVPSHPSLIRKLQNRKQHLQSAIILDTHRHLWRYLHEIDFVYAGATSDFGIHQRNADELIDGELRFTTCQYGRVHTNLTNLPRAMRDHLRFRGQELSNIDVVNSQPMFLGLLLLNYFTNSCMQSAIAFNLNQELDSFYTNPDLCFSFNSTNTRKGKGEIQPLCGNIPINPQLASLSIPNDLKTYISLCESGTIYEYLMKHVQMPDRDRMKKMYYSFLYGQIKHEPNSPLHACMNQEFPSVMEACHKIKEKDHAKLGQTLQRHESAFITNRVIRRMMTDHPDICVSTIYDSVITTTEHVPIVEAIIKQEFGELCIRPQLKTTRLAPSTAAMAC